MLSFLLKALFPPGSPPRPFQSTCPFLSTVGQDSYSPALHDSVIIISCDLSVSYKPQSCHKTLKITNHESSGEYSNKYLLLICIRVGCGGTAHVSVGSMMPPGLGGWLCFKRWVQLSLAPCVGWVQVCSTCTHSGAERHHLPVAMAGVPNNEQKHTCLQA